MEGDSTVYIIDTWVFDSISEAAARQVAAERLMPVPDNGEDAVTASARPDGGMVSALGIALIVVLLLNAVNAPFVSKALKKYRNDLFDVRKRANAFNSTGNAPLPGAITLACLLCVSGGICLWSGVRGPESVYTGAFACMGLCAVYYLLQLMVYNMVGYTFSTPEGQHNYICGFVATQAFAGLGLSIPAGIYIAHPEWGPGLTLCAVILYLSARILFIIKGFRIFYKGIGSFFYFILYLCTLEIIPAWMMVMGASALSSAFSL